MQTKGRNYFWGRNLLISFIGIMIVQDTKWNICIATLKKRMLFQIFLSHCDIYMKQKMYRINEQLNLIYTQKREGNLRSREI